MTPPVIDFIGGEAALATLAEALGGMVMISHAQVLDAQRLTFIEDDGFSEDELKAAVATLGARAVLMTRKRGMEQPAALFAGSSALRHLESHPLRRRGDVSLVVARALGLRPSVRLEDFVNDASPIEIVMTSTVEQQDVVDVVQDWATEQGASLRVVDQLGVGVLEAISNAFYNAPIDDRGVRPFAHLHRREEVTLPAGHQVKVRFGVDNDRFGFEVEDSYGTLTAHDVTSALYRCLSGDSESIVSRSGGAGIGLFLAFQTMTKVVFDVAAGRRNRMLAFCERTKTNREFTELPRSLHFFDEPCTDVEHKK